MAVKGTMSKYSRHTQAAKGKEPNMMVLKHGSMSGTKHKRARK